MRGTPYLGLGVLLLAAPLLSAGFADGWEKVGEPAKPFVVQGLAGGSLNSTQLMGKVVVIDLWATWCTPCVQELPELQALSRRWESRKDVVLLSFNVTEDKSVVEAFVRQNRITFPVYLGDPFLDIYDVQVFPTKMIFDFRKPPGTLRFRGEGRLDVVSIEKRVSELLGRLQPAVADRHSE